MQATLQGKIAVVTGGNSGIGYSTARRLKEEGATVIITGRRKEAVAKAAAELGVTGITANQAMLKETAALVSEIAQKHGKIDILLINAGITGLAPISETTEALFDEIMNVNLKGAFFTLSKCIPLLNDGASVIMLSSTSATISPVNAAVYAASKAAVNALVKIAAAELANRKIRVNAVSPGPVATEIMQKIGLNDELEAQLKSSIPLSRLGTPNEVAEMILYLSGNHASFITGANFLIDGGQGI